MKKFAEKVFEAVCKIPKGKVTTYKQIAIYAGSPGACRAVGNILHRNPTPIVVPCHRVVNSNGRLAPEFAFGGFEMQKELLNRENVTVKDWRVDLNKYMYIFNTTEQ